MGLVSLWERRRPKKSLSPLSPLCEGSARRLSAGLEADSPQEPNWHSSVSRTMKNKFQLSHPVYGILKLYNFSCTVIIWHPHTLQSDHQDKSSSYLPLPYSWLPSLVPPTPPTLFPSSNYESDLCIYEFAFISVLFFRFHAGMLNRFSCVQLFATLWVIAHQSPLSMGFSRQEYWSGLPCPPPADLPNPGVKPCLLMSLTLADRFFTTSIMWQALLRVHVRVKSYSICLSLYDLFHLD